VWLTSVTEQWATVAVVGPDSRDLLAGLTGIPLDAVSFPFMAIREGDVAGIPVRVCRISFSGELAYEVNVDGRRGLELWEAVMAAGEVTPYGTETMHVLRAEKGYPIIGQETDGSVTPQDLGLDWIVSKTKPDFLGKRSFTRTDTSRADRKQLVGLLPLDPTELLPEGAQLVADPDLTVPMPMLGHVTSGYRSAALGRTFALALVKSGRERIGETVYAPLPGRTMAAEVVESVLYDKEGMRRDGRPD
jgi:sarcosine oxidase subunit alpha